MVEAAEKGEWLFDDPDTSRGLDLLSAMERAGVLESVDAELQELWKAAPPWPPDYSNTVTDLLGYRVLFDPAATTRPEARFVLEMQEFHSKHINRQEPWNDEEARDLVDLIESKRDLLGLKHRSPRSTRELANQMTGPCHRIQSVIG